MVNGSIQEHSIDTTKLSKNGKESTEIVVSDLSPRALQLKEFDTYTPVNMLYKEFIGKTYIEKYKQEDFVIKEIVRGNTINNIARQLNERVPNVVSTVTWTNDIQKFMERSDELLLYFERDRNDLAKRHLDAKAKVEEQLAELALFTKKLIIEANNKGEIANSISAVNALVKVYQQYNLLTGFGGGTGPVSGDPSRNQTNILINIGDTKMESLKDRANKADFKIVDVTPEDIQEPK